MLVLIKKKKKNLKRLFVGDKLNLIYRFKGVFFVMMGICVFNRKKSLCIYWKKKSFSLFFSLLYINLRDVYKFNTFFFNNIKWKKFYRGRI